MNKPMSLAQRNPQKYGATASTTGTNMNMPDVEYPIQNYDDLKQSIMLWCDRDDEEFVNQIPNFIDFAQKEIYRTNRWMFMNKEVYLPVTDGKATLPSDYLSAQYMFFNTGTEKIEETSFDEISFLLNKNKNSGQPFTPDQISEIVKFAVVGTRLYFNYPLQADVPDQDDNGTGDIPENAIVFGYYADPQRMDDGSDSPYLLQIAPDLMLYSACYAASIFVVDQDLANAAQAQVDRIVGSLNKQEEMLTYSASAKVVPPPRAHLFF